MADPLNILFVISDQHHAGMMGCAGHAQALTPHMDRLAAEGVRFAHAYAQNPICTPSRVSILSGQYCHNTGYYGLHGPTPLALPSLPGHLRAHGYRTALIGKLHLPNNPDRWAADGCDLYCECMRPDYPGHEYYDHLRARGVHELCDHEALPEFPGGQQHEGRPSNLSYEDSVEGWSVQRAIRFIEDDDTRPFFMQVSFFRPHQCYTPAQQFWDMYPDDLPLPETINQDPGDRPPHFRRKFESYRKAEGLIEPKGFEHVSRRVWHGYLGAITHCDHALGQLLDHLEKTGLAERTIVIYGSDHGAYSGQFGIPEKAPGICSEAVCRVPMIWRVPGLTPSGAVCDQLVENLDLAATIPALCGLPAMDTTDGHDITSLLKGDSQPVRKVAVTENPWSKSIRWDRWRMVHYQREMFAGEDVGQLYDIHADPLETTNLYADPDHQSVVQEGRRRLLDWLIQSTRHVTAWTPPKWPNTGEMTAGDAKESNEAGIAVRIKRGMIDYI